MSIHKKIVHHSRKILSGARETLGYFQKKIQNIQDRAKQPEYVSFPVSEEEKKEGNEKRVVEISMVSAIKIIAVIFGILLLSQFLGKIGYALTIFFVSLFLASALTPGVDWLQKKKIPPSLGVLFLYIAIFGIFTVIVAGLLPVLIDQVSSIIAYIRDRVLEVNQGDFSQLPAWMQQYKDQIRVALDEINQIFLNMTKNGSLIDLLNQNSKNITEFSRTVASGIIGTIFGFINVVVNIFLILITTYFIVIDRKNIKTFFVNLFPRHYQNYASKKATAMQEKIAKWVHGQMVLFFLVGGIAYIGLQLIGVPYALTLALIAGLGEFFPFFGPPIAFLCAAPIAFGQGVEIGLLSAALYLFIQMIDGNILIPLIMEKAVGISPLVSIIAMLIGFAFFGIPGIIVAIPMAAMVQIFIGDYIHWRGVNDIEEEKEKDDS